MDLCTATSKGSPLIANRRRRRNPRPSALTGRPHRHPAAPRPRRPDLIRTTAIPRGRRPICWNFSSSHLVTLRRVAADALPARMPHLSHENGCSEGVRPSRRSGSVDPHGILRRCDGHRSCRRSGHARGSPPSEVPPDRGGGPAVGPGDLEPERGVVGGERPGPARGAVSLKAVHCVIVSDPAAARRAL